VVTPPIPFFQLNRLEVLAAGNDEASCAIEVTEWLAGTPELGVQAAASALGDAVHMYAASSRRSEGSMPVTVDLRLDFWSDPPALGSRLVGRAWVEPSNGEVLLVRGQIESDQTIVATGVVRALITAVAGSPPPNGATRSPITELVPPIQVMGRHDESAEAVLRLPAARLAGLELTALGEGTIEFSALPGRELERTGDVVHGGAVVVLGSLASAGVLAVSVSPGTPLRRLGLSAEYLRPTPIGVPLRIRARIAHRTKRLASVHAEIATQNGKPTARIYESVELALS
jgi:uncharacterized protein (TIGR00369 family)